MNEKPKLGWRYQWLGCECEIVALVGDHSVKLRMTQPDLDPAGKLAWKKTMPWPLPVGARRIS